MLQSIITLAPFFVNTIGRRRIAYTSRHYYGRGSPGWTGETPVLPPKGFFLSSAGVSPAIVRQPPAGLR